MYETVVYSSTALKKMKQTKAKFKPEPEAENHVINIYPRMKYQTIQGFGSAFTDASAVNFSKMSSARRDEFMKLMFDRRDGIGLNYCRTHINSCDFAEKKYSYINEGDEFLESFSIEHDEENIIPMINLAKKHCADELKLFCSPWSPPAFMKTNNNMLLGGRLIPEYYQAWANYFVKYILAFREHNIEFEALTVQNEPMATQTWESCRWSAEETVEFVRDYLSPALRGAGLDTKIMIWDHNKEHIVDWAQTVADTNTSDVVDGIAFHWYSGSHFDAVKMTHEILPDALLVESEFCVGVDKGDINGRWENAMKYAHDILGNLNSFTNAITDWNILLDENGGPYHARFGGCGAMMRYDTRADKLVTAHSYYAMGHFSKFIERGAVRLGTSSYNSALTAAAFENPNGEIVLVMVNSGRACKATVRLDNMACELKLSGSSITTLVINHK